MSVFKILGYRGRGLVSIFNEHSRRESMEKRRRHRIEVLDRSSSSVCTSRYGTGQVSRSGLYSKRAT